MDIALALLTDLIGLLNTDRVDLALLSVEGIEGLKAVIEGIRAGTESDRREKQLDPEDLDEVSDGVKFRIASDDNSIRAKGGGDGEGIGIGDGKLSLHPGCFKDISEGVGHALDREGLQAMEELLSLLQGSRLCDDVVHLPDVDLAHQEGLARDLGSMHQLLNLFEPFFFVEEGEHGEGIEQIWLLHVFGHPVAPSGGLW